MSISVARVVRNSALLGAILAGCVDTSPLDFQELPPDATPGDADVPDGLIASCRECITGDSGPCRSMFDSCTPIPKCGPLVLCLIDRGCFRLPTLEGRIGCGTPCLQELGITAGSDPAVTGVLRVNACTLEGCRTACTGE
jgi:hypothetical protein